MPRGDKTGPMGAGPMSGRALGAFTDGKISRDGFGFGMRSGRRFACRRGPGGGYGRGFGIGQYSTKTQKELLEEEKNSLKSHLEVIEKELENLK